MIIVKSFFHIDNGFKKGSKVKNISLYQHIASASYRKYLARTPKSKYLKDAKKIIKQGEKINDPSLIRKGYLKLQALKNNDIKFNEINKSSHKVMFENNKIVNDYAPLHINLVISPNIGTYEYPLAQLHFYYLMVIKHLKHNQNNNGLWNYYGAYHNDTDHPHFHLVIYQNKYGYDKKPLNTLEKARQIYSSQVLKAIKQDINNIHNYRDKSFLYTNEIIEKLINQIKQFNGELNEKQIFVCRWLLKALNYKYNDLTFEKNHNKLYNIFIKYKNYYQKINDYGGEIKEILNVDNKVHSLGLLIKKNNELYDKEKIRWFQNFINDIQNDNFNHSLTNENQKENEKNKIIKKINKGEK